MISSMMRSSIHQVRSAAANGARTVCTSALHLPSHAAAATARTTPMTKPTTQRTSVLGRTGPAATTWPASLLPASMHLARGVHTTALAAAAGAGGGAAPIKLLGISGSLRKGSSNTGLLRAAARRLPPGVTFEIADLSGLPLYNDDLWQGKSDDSALPEAIRKLRAQVAAADAIVFACPEYNFSVSSVLKTALDWGSKNPNVFSGKPACVLGAGGGAGTARAQAHLRNIATFLNILWAPFPNDSLQLNRFIPNSGFDGETGEVTDKGLEDRVAGVVAHTVNWARAVKPALEATATADAKK